MKLLLPLLLLISSFNTWSAPNPVEAPLKIGVVQEWSQFNPVNLNVASTMAMSRFVVRPMTSSLGNGQPLPDLAEQIPSKKNGQVKIITDNGRKKVVAQWTIKTKANWGDGTPVTCKDWWLGWQAGSSTKVMVNKKNNFTKIEKIEWNESKNKVCSVTYVNDDWTFDRDLPWPLPAHLEQSIFDKWKSQTGAYEQNSLYAKAPTTKGLYNGPYTVDQFVLGSHFILVKNPHFGGQTAQIEKIIVKHVGDSATLKAHLTTGDINMVSSVGFPPDLALQMDEELQNSKLNLRVRFEAGPLFQGVFFNLDNEVLKDKRIREALARAIDKRELVKAFFKNKMLAASGPLAPTNPAYTQRPDWYSPAESKKLLAEAGWTPNEKGRLMKNGKPLVLEFRTSAGIKILETLQTYICAQFTRLGAECVAKNQPPRVFLGEAVPHGDFVLAMFGQAILPDTTLRGLFAASEIPTKENSWAGGNSGRFRSAKMDELMTKFDQEWNAQARRKLMKQMDAILFDERVFIPLYHRREAVVMPKNLTGYMDDIQGTDFIFPEKWTLK